MTFTMDIKHSGWVFDIFGRGNVIMLLDPQFYVILSDPVFITLTVVGVFWMIAQALTCKHLSDCQD
jgi:hypothetical protein